VRSLSFAERVAIRATAGFAQAAAAGSTLLVLHYHRVAPVPDALFPDYLDPQVFDAHLALLKSAFNPLPLTEALERLARRSLPPRAVAITFDDGYADNHDVALPILQRHKVCATFYVATAYLQGGNMFNDTVIEALRKAPDELDLRDMGLGEYRLVSVQERRAAIEAVIAAIKYQPPSERRALADALYGRCVRRQQPSLMMNPQQVRALATAGMEIGAHTVTHPILLRLDADAARTEIAQSRDDLQSIIGSPVTTFAYPNGKPGVDYGVEHAAAARAAGYRHALTTSWGCITPQSDPWQLPRVAPWDRTPLRFGARLALTYRERNAAVAS
jgi:peptidoglycan/xylan/chitin deacetylase (PgdA/CDA1 family)